jgi:hypothetical protein
MKNGHSEIKMPIISNYGRLLIQVAISLYGILPRGAYMSIKDLVATVFDLVRVK